MIELEEKYKLVHCFRTSDEKGFLNQVSELSSKANLKQIYKKRRDGLVKDKIDVSSFLIWLFENYPNSVNCYISDDSVQDNFKSISRLNN